MWHFRVQETAFYGYVRICFQNTNTYSYNPQKSSNNETYKSPFIFWSFWEAFLTWKVWPVRTFHKLGTWVLIFPQARPIANESKLTDKRPSDSTYLGIILVHGMRLQHVCLSWVAASVRVRGCLLEHCKRCGVMHDDWHKFVSSSGEDHHYQATVQMCG